MVTCTLVDSDAELVSVVPHGIHLGVTRETESVFRVDSLTYPEMYAILDMSVLSNERAVVQGRFADGLFAGGVNERPLARWLVEGEEFEVSSPGKEFVAVFKL